MMVHPNVLVILDTAVMVLLVLTLMNAQTIHTTVTLMENVRILLVHSLLLVKPIKLATE